MDIFKPSGSSANEQFPPVVTFLKYKVEQYYSTGQYGSGRWYVDKSEKKSILHINLESGGFFAGPDIFFHEAFTGQYINPNTTWLIKRLYGNKMHLVQYSNNNTYDLEFEKV